MSYSSRILNGLSYPCKDCRAPVPQGKHQCTSCGAWQNVTELLPAIPRENGPAERVRPPVTPLSEAEDITHNRYESGPWDILYGGGVAWTSVTLLSAKSGCGKTTKCFQMWKRIAQQTDRTALMAAGEMSMGELKSYAVRLGVTTPELERLHFIPIVHGLDLVAEIIERRPAICFLDSLPTIVSAERAVRYVLELKHAAITAECPIIVLNHSTKDSQAAGYEAVRHFVDTTITIVAPDPPKPSKRVRKSKPDDAPALPEAPSFLRHFATGPKSRFGREAQCTLLMTDTGFVALPPKPELERG